ncbi:MAG TPA: tannase/feruloyl esterase family alpha/beta hydrolase [Steroidobacteraceae bacterium]|nr:tannase/feruloyl esterase family alpha/beta hydrolase [Steroidobacteraceae bacterium]
MSRAACRTGLLIIFLVPMGALGQAAPEAGLASASVQRVPIPDRSAVMPILDCANLVQHDFSTVAEAPTRVQSAAIEAATAERAEFCLVKGYVAPTIQFELRLPTTRWTGRYLQGGCGGNCGVILSGLAPRCDIQVAYAGSFAVGFENSGHSGGDGVWALGGQSVREDFAFRAAHAFSVAAKAIMSVYYGRTPEFSYFQGCSDGGREAMMETQRYAADFNGVIAGSPAFAIAEAMERFIWEARWGRDAQGSLVLDLPAVTLLHAAVMKACDALDGVKDGQLDDPRLCHFDPGTLVCRGGQSPPQCLTASQAEVARKLYAGPVDENGRHLFYGGEPYGSELSWVERYALPIMGAAMFDDAVQNMIFQHAPDSAASVQAWRFDAQTFAELSRRGALYDARSSDLRGFRERGGKLILWQGFADPAAGAYGLPDYYYRLSREVGGFEAARSFARMFLIPGVYHCAGGYVPYEEDLLGALVSWVELGHAPDSVMATALLKEGGSRSRPVFAYPVQSRYRGRGDVNDPRNFAASTPKSSPMDLYDWAGAPSNNP